MTEQTQVSMNDRDEDRRALLALMRERHEKMAALLEREAWMRIVQEEYQREAAKIHESVNYLETQIKVTAERLIPEGKKSVDIPGYGRVQFRDYKDAIRIALPETFITWAEEAERPDLYEVVEVKKLKRTEATKVAEEALLTEGVTLPGVEFKPARREAYIEEGVTFDD